MSTVLIAVVVVVVVFAAVAAVLLVVSGRRQRTRFAELTGMVAQRGWTYEPQNNSYSQRFLGFPLSWHRGADMFDVVTGMHRNHHMLACGYTQRLTGANNDTGYGRRYLIVAVALPGPRPMVEIANRAVKDRDRTELGQYDIGLADPDLDALYRMRAEDPNTALALLTPPLRELLARDQRAHRWPLRFERSDLVTWEEGELDMNRLVWMLDYLVDVAERVPAG